MERDDPILHEHSLWEEQLQFHAYTDAHSLAAKLIRTDGTLVLSGGTLIDGTGAAPLPNATVVIRDGIVVDAGTRPYRHGARPDIRTIDTTGQFMIPGLIDCHVHFTGDHVEIRIGPDGKRIFEETATQRKYMEPIHKLRIIRSAANANLLLDAGFTTVRDIGHADAAHIAAVQHAIRCGLIAGPDIVRSGWALSQTGGHGKVAIWPYEIAHQLRPRSSFADGVKECVAHVERNIREGAECIKIYTSEGMVNAPDRLEGLPNYSLHEITAMVDAAHRHGLRTTAHAVTVDSCRMAIMGGIDTIEHGPNTVDQGLLDLMLKRKTVLVPTLESYDFAAAGRQDHVYGRWVGERAARRLVGRLAFVRRAFEMGIQIACGTGAGAPPRGGRNARELELLVQAGLSPLQAIRVATQGSAINLGRDREIGTIRTGRRADILVLGKDPVANISVLRDRANILRIVQPRLLRPFVS